MKLLYFADPMCSWCWGFSPVLDAIVERVSDQAELEVVMGGLRPGTTRAMDDAMKTELRAHWMHVEAASRQPFDHTFFDRDGFIYDTEPASRAVVTVRSLAQDRVRAYLREVQGAFYRDGRDVTTAETLGELATSVGVERSAFDAVFGSEETRTATQADFDRSAGLGIRGFPTLVGSSEQGLQALSLGFQPAHSLVPIVSTWLEGRA